MKDQPAPQFSTILKLDQLQITVMKFIQNSIHRSFSLHKPRMEFEKNPISEKMKSKKYMIFQKKMAKSNLEI